MIREKSGPRWLDSQQKVSEYPWVVQMSHYVNRSLKHLMATTFLLFLVLIAGYLFLINTDVTKYRIFALSGQHVYLYSAIAGFIGLLFVVQIFYWLLFRDAGPPTGKIMELVYALALGIPVILIAIFLPLYLNRKFPDEPDDLRSSALLNQGNLVGWMVLKAHKERSLIEIGLRDGSTVVGGPVVSKPPEFPLPGRVTFDIALVPLSNDQTNPQPASGANEDTASCIERWRKGEDSLAELPTGRSLLIVPHSAVVSMQFLNK